MAHLMGSTALPRVLLLESDGLVRGTVAAVCRDLALAQVIQCVSCESAIQLLKLEPVDAGLVSLTDEGTFDLIARLRSGELGGSQDLPLAVTAQHVDASIAQQLKVLRIRRLLLKPFKIRDAVATLEGLVSGLSVTT
jgi:hypothetical protein